jgi:hypothetical protein
MIKDAYGNTRFYGVYRGIVYENSDPEDKGRLRLKVPQILADQPTEWAWPVETPGVETEVPLNGQGVWVMFEGGDLSYPIWIGQFGNAVKRKTAATGVITAAAFNPVSFEPTTMDTIDINYGAFEGFVNQAATTTTAQAMALDTTDYARGVYISNTNRVNFRTAGVYNLEWSGQFQNTSNSIEDMNVWIRVNGVDVAGSNGVISIPARKSASAGQEAHEIIGWNYYLKLKANDYVQLMWNATNTTVSLQTYSGQVSGPAIPSTAALIFTATQVA